MQDDLAIRIRASASSSRKINEQFSRRYGQGLCNFYDVFESNVAFPTLYSTDVIAMKSCPLRKFLLRQASFRAKRSHCASKSGLNGLREHLSSFGR